MRQYTICFFLFLFYLSAIRVSAQDRTVQDTLSTRLTLLNQLTQAGNFEQAQVEGEFLREFLKRHELPVTPKLLMLLSTIYKANQDDRSATRMLAEAELDARKDPNPVTKAALLTALVQECRKWELPDQALTCQQMLASARDSIQARERRAEASGLKQQFDSLSNLRAQEMTEQGRYLKIEKQQGLILAGVLVAILLFLAVSLAQSNTKWNNTLKKKELEWEIMRGNLRKELEETASMQVIEATNNAAAKPLNTPYAVYQGPEPEQIALLIEPNRQVVLYLKSLLSDRFQIETARTPAEGLQMANDLLPDLVVCDALLNGQSGIEIARQIKLSERTNHIPVVLLTNKFGNEGKLDALRAGADVWFSRPVIDDEFDASVQRLLDARKVRHDEFTRFMHLYFTDHKIALQDPFLMHTIHFIEQNLANPDFMADEIARKMQMTNTHFTKKLNVLTGKEPVQLIREMRLEKAKTLLEKRAGNPGAISELVGFSNPGTFALAFKEYFGENTLLLYSLPPNRMI
ncbi:MAG: response regulator transcription factor [Saprospiraceae bacterium]|nr:response regulator transcription factor [Saprospiraceae bacterium]